MRRPSMHAQILEDDSDDEAEDEEDGERKLARAEKKEEERKMQVQCSGVRRLCLTAAAHAAYSEMRRVRGMH